MYKLILLDYSMPDLDGPQVAILVREIICENENFGEANVPYICCCTAYAEASFKKNAEAAGMDHFVTKPI